MANEEKTLNRGPDGSSIVSENASIRASSKSSDTSLETSLSPSITI
jgi:hypothetical protein